MNASAGLYECLTMRQTAMTRGGFTLVEAMILVAALLVFVALALPGITLLRERARQAQNARHMRGITRGMFSYAESSKTGGPQGWYPGIRNSGDTIPVGDAIPAAQLAAVADVPGYAATASPDVLPDEMNGPGGRGFIVRAMAELAAGDFIPAGSAESFINPVEPVKTPFLAGGAGAAGRFDASKISYTTLDLSKSDGGVFAYKSTWKEDAHPAAVLLADRAVGDGSEPATRSSVWTEPGSGDWRGSIALHDGSASFVAAAETSRFYLGEYDKLAFGGGSLGGAFDRNLKLLTSPPSISFGSGLLYDEADSGTDPNAF